MHGRQSVALPRLAKCIRQSLPQRPLFCRGLLLAVLAQLLFHVLAGQVEPALAGPPLLHADALQQRLTGCWFSCWRVNFSGWLYPPEGLLGNRHGDLPWQIRLDLSLNSKPGRVGRGAACEFGPELSHVPLRCQASGLARFRKEDDSPNKPPNQGQLVIKPVIANYGIVQCFCAAHGSDGGTAGRCSRHA